MSPAIELPSETIKRLRSDCDRLLAAIREHRQAEPGPGEHPDGGDVAYAEEWTDWAERVRDPKLYAVADEVEGR